MEAGFYAEVRVAAVSPNARDRFRRWVSAYTHLNLARSLHTSRRQVHFWTQKNNPDQPAEKTMKEIIALSIKHPLGIGPLDYKDFFGEVEIASHTLHSFGRRSMLATRQIQTRRVL